MILVYDNCACKIREVEEVDPGCDVPIPERLYIVYDGEWIINEKPTGAWTEITFVRQDPVII